MAEEERGNPRLNLPSPDPSALTTSQLHAAVENLRALIAADIRAVETRLDAIDKATEIFTENLTRVPTDTDRQIQHLKELHEARFGTVEMQFAERGQRTIEAIANSRLSLETALMSARDAAAARETANAAAIGKSEHAFTKQIDAIMSMRTSDMHTMEGKIEDLKGRLDRTEGRTTGGRDVVTERRLDIGSGVAILSAGLAFGTAVIALLGYISLRSPAPAVPAPLSPPYILQLPSPPPPPPPPSK